MDNLTNTLTPLLYLPGERLLRLSEVILLTGMSKSQIYKLIAENQFPKPIKLSHNGRASAWIYSEVSDYIDFRIQQSRQNTTGISLPTKSKGAES